ncbi:hypothetical protein [Synechococcus sp. CCY 9618]|uniref:hypothetical protein n=1 Tax=Synechococcus sp. CCY 9618 TaxID=2815602 RepID=UPI001C23B734|nr:hypothetical protein [Synechococcus sp. CCY 9618]
MSYLRQIMQRLHDRSSAEPAVDGGGPTRLEEHLALYAIRLQGCSDAMLDYEAAWLEQHIETLELCSHQPAMVAGAGGSQRVERLLQESHRFRQLLDQCRDARGLAQAGAVAAVVATEHAWELSDPALRQAWGFPDTAAAEPPTQPSA